MLDTLVAAVGPELAEAIALALALDPRERYQSAREMGRAISDGADGISPLESPARSRSASRGRAQQATQATSVLSGGARGSSGAGAKPAVAPRQPRLGPARSVAVAGASARPAAAAASSSSRSRGPRRLAAALLGLLALVGVIAAIIAITAPAPTRVVLRNVVYNDVEQASVALKQLVSENTK
jgi:cobalamin biosynthesis Mg chelatase CobN